MRRCMLVLAAICLALGAAQSARAQGDESALIEKRDKKLQEAFLKKAAWLTDFDDAKAKAKEDGKLIFTYFTRSYAH